ncbi:MAG TPA: hypothetical protein VJ996_00435, partial [Solirubrobacteraceae bacterium]|nr:hypothetical protein [Solirubrobacteraceae bacterium]
NRVFYVALPDAPLDSAGRLEGKLVAGGLPYLRELWHSAHWRLFATSLTRPATAPAPSASTASHRRAIPSQPQARSRSRSAALPALPAEPLVT